MNGEKLDMQKLVKKGYAYITRRWEDGDVVEVEFPMEVRKAYANQHVREDAGCVALLRGPVVYCFEGVDNGELIQSLRIPKKLEARAHRCEEGVLKGNVLLEFEGIRMVGSQALYSEEPPVKEKARMTGGGP